MACKTLYFIYVPVQCNKNYKHDICPYCIMYIFIIQGNHYVLQEVCFSVRKGNLLYINLFDM
jgi:hypothetical protein